MTKGPIVLGGIDGPIFVPPPELANGPLPPNLIGGPVPPLQISGPLPPGDVPMGPIVVN